MVFYPKLVTFGAVNEKTFDFKTCMCSDNDNECKSDPNNDDESVSDKRIYIKWCSNIDLTSVTPGAYY